MLRILSFNILASIYSHQDYYPDGLGDLLDISYRKSKICGYISKGRYDIIGLQEVTDEIYQNIKECLGDSYISMFYPHNMEYWKEWIPNEYSYIPNGNAIFLKRDNFKLVLWEDISLETGNHAVAAYTQHIESGNQIRILNIHLEGDDEDQRVKEYNDLLNTLKEDAKTIDIVLGDFNSGIIDDISKITYENNFIPDNNKIHTFSIISSDKTKNPIDHIIYRSPNISKFSIHIDKEIWDLYPFNNNEEDKYMKERCEECLARYGSDHIPLMGLLVI